MKNHKNVDCFVLRDAAVKVNGGAANGVESKPRTWGPGHAWSIRVLSRAEISAPDVLHRHLLCFVTRRPF